MTNPSTPGQEGPSYAPPPLPEGWIAQWDGVSKKYYFVQLSNGASQWVVPTEAASTVGTPTAIPNHESLPYPEPGQQQTPTPDGPAGDRSLGSMAMNQLLHTGGGQGGGYKQSNPLVGLAGQLLGGGKQSTGGGYQSNPGPGGLVGALAGSLLGGGNKPNQGPQQSYSGQAPQGGYGQQGSLMEKLSGMLGGTNQGQQNYGYSGGSSQGGYMGQAPPASYQSGVPGQQAYNPSQQSYPPQQIPGGYANQPPQIYPQYPPPGQSPAPNQYYNSQQPQYSGASQQQQQHEPPPPYGLPPQQPYPSPAYGQQPSGNLEQPHHHMYQGLHNASHQGGLYGDANSNTSPPLAGSHPNQGPQGGYGAPGPGQGNYY